MVQMNSEVNFILPVIYKLFPFIYNDVLTGNYEEVRNDERELTRMVDESLM